MVSYDATTETVRITVRPAYLDGKSDAMARQFVFAYFVRVENHGDDDVQLLRRRWTITDGHGHVEEVRGPGVVGEQPVIEPGGSYAYASGCPLPTDSGSMVGAYYMTDAEGRSFEVEIPAFSLDTPGARRVLN